MADTSDLTPEDTAALLDYARRRYAQEQYPLDPRLREVRVAIEKMRQRTAPLPPPRPPGEPTWKTQVKQRARR